MMAYNKIPMGNSQAKIPCQSIGSDTISGNSTIALPVAIASQSTTNMAPNAMCVAVKTTSDNRFRRIWLQMGHHSKLNSTAGTNSNAEIAKITGSETAPGFCKISAKVETGSQLPHKTALNFSTFLMGFNP